MKNLVPEAKLAAAIARGASKSPRSPTRAIGTGFARPHEPSFIVTKDLRLLRDGC